MPPFPPLVMRGLHEEVSQGLLGLGAIDGQEDRRPVTLATSGGCGFGLHSAPSPQPRALRQEGDPREYSAFTLTGQKTPGA